MAEDDDAVRALYFEMLKQWNQRSARANGALSFSIIRLPLTMVAQTIVPS